MGLGTGAIRNDQGTIFTVSTSQEIERKYGLKEKTLSYWRNLGEGPDYFTVGRWIFYVDKDVEKWIKQTGKGGKYARINKAGELPFGADACHEHGEKPEAARCSSEAKDTDVAFGDHRPVRHGIINRFFNRLLEGVKGNG